MREIHDLLNTLGEEQNITAQKTAPKDEAWRYRKNARSSRRCPTDAANLSHCRFSIALQPLRIGDLGDFVGIVTDHLQFILRERRMVRHLSAG